MSAGKGSRPRNCFSRLFKLNYEEIEWRNKGAYCYSCGQDIDRDVLKNYSDKFIFYPDGHVEHKKCKFC